MVSVPDLVAIAKSSPVVVGQTRVVFIDGPAGSGKSTLAAQLGSQLPAEIIHLDDMYDGWTQNLDLLWERIYSQIISPLAHFACPCYQRYDWNTGVFANWVKVPPQAYLIVEGCGAASGPIAAYAALSCWVEVPDAVRLRRGLIRDGSHERDHWVQWIAAESAHFARHRTRERVDVILDGTYPFRT